MSYKICGWDVGIKNLAYCILEITESNFNIASLGVINLTENDKKYCSSSIKGKTTCCNKLAKFCALSPNTQNIEYYCGTHKAQHNQKININENDIVVPLLTIATCSNPKCKIKSKFTIFDKNVCTTHKNKIFQNYIKSFAITKIKKTKCYSTDLEHLGECMFSKLDELNISANYVYIENQPSMKSPTMKSISMLLFSYFIMKKKTNNIEQIKFIAPSSKLKIDSKDYEKLFTEIIADIKIKSIIDKILALCELELINDNYNIIVQSLINKPIFDQLVLTNKIPDETKRIILENKHIYELTKSISVKYAEHIINKHGPQWSNYFNNLKKKDDVADALLHALKKIKN